MPVPVPPPLPLNSESDDSGSDTSSDIVEMGPDDFPASFREQGGRLFHSHGPSPYPLPVDAAEQSRLNGQHAMLYSMMREHFVGPVEDVLRHSPGVRRRVVDLGTGTGQWVLDMAARFPHVHFKGLDIAPIQTRRPPRNVWFVMADIKDDFTYHNGTIDLVHARDIGLGFSRHDYCGILREVARVLRRGGLFVACEWHRYPVMADGSDAVVHAPHTVAVCSAIDRFLRLEGLSGVAHQVPRWLIENGSFEDPRTRQYNVPIGGTHANFTERRRLRELRDMMSVFLESARCLLMRGGHNEAAINTLKANCLRELENTPGIMFTYHTVYAVKR